MTSIPGTGTAEVEIKDMIPSDADRPMTYSKTMKLIYKVSNILMESLNINEVFDMIMDCLFDLLKRIDRGAILLIDSKTGKLKKIVARSKYDGRKTTLDYSRSVVDRVIKEGKPVTVSDTSQEEKDNLSVSLEKIRSVMCVPLISRSEIRGVIYVDSLDMPHGFRNEDLLLLPSLSTPMAIAIENALLYSDLDKSIITSQEASNLVKDYFIINLEKKYPEVSLKIAGEAQTSNELIFSLTKSFIIAIISIYFLLVLLFNSFSQPLFVLSAVPFGLIGVIWALFFHNQIFSTY